MKSILVSILLFVTFALSAQNLAWAKSYSNSQRSYNPQRIIVSKEKKIVVTGTTYSLSFFPLFVDYMDSVGNLQWTSMMTNVSLSPYATAFNSKSDLYFAFHTDGSFSLDNLNYTSENCLVKYKSNGTKDFVHLFDGADIKSVATDKSDNAYLLFQLKDTAILYGQPFYPQGALDMLIIKIDSSDTFVKSFHFKGKAVTTSINIADDNSLVVTGFLQDSLYIGTSGYCWSYGTEDGDPFICKINQSGSSVFLSKLANSYNWQINSVSLNEAYCAVSKSLSSNHGFRLNYIDVFDSTGLLLNQDTVEFAEFSYTAYSDNTLWDLHSEVYYSSDPESLTTTSTVNLVLVQRDDNGSSVLRDTIKTPGVMCSVTGDKSGNIYVLASTKPLSSFNVYDTILANPSTYLGYFIAKLHSNSTVETVQEHGASDLFRLYPNPTTGLFFLNARIQKEKSACHVKNIMGQSVCEYETLPIRVDLTAYPKGMYFVELISGDKREVKKVIVE